MTAAIRILLAAATLSILVSIWWPPGLYVKLAGPIAHAEITAKREFFKLPGDERWRHVFEITYRYQPPGESETYTSTEPVDQSVYVRHKVGSEIPVRYSPWPALRPWRGVGSVIDETSFFSRFPLPSNTTRLAFDLGWFAASAIAGWIAWRRKTQPHLVLAAFLVAILLSGIIPVGFAVYPGLLALSRKFPRKGYALVCLAAMAVAPAVLYWRIPKAPPEPAVPVRNAVAKIHQVITVEEVWQSGHETGDELPVPYQMAEIEFVPDGAHEPVRTLDMVDLDSTRGLKPGGQVGIAYSVQDARQARISGATRTWPDKAFRHFLGQTYGVAAIVIALGWLGIHLRHKLGV